MGGSHLADNCVTQSTRTRSLDEEFVSAEKCIINGVLGLGKSRLVHESGVLGIDLVTSPPGHWARVKGLVIEASE